MNKTYSALRVTSGKSIPLFEGQVRRLGAGCRAPLQQFAEQAHPGVYRVWWDGASLTTSARPASRLIDGMAARFLVSPFTQMRGRFRKPAPPSLYDSVRLDGVATLLTDVDGLEVYESCVASVVAWDGQSLVLAPFEAPAVDSLAEAELAARVPHRRATLEVESDWPLLLLNAVAGTCAVAVPGRTPFPSVVRAQIDAALAA